jgi:hypothetical protein
MANIVTNGLKVYYNSKEGVDGNTWQNIAPDTEGDYDLTINGATHSQDGFIFDGIDDFCTTEFKFNPFGNNGEFTFSGWGVHDDGGETLNGFISMFDHSSPRIRKNACIYVYSSEYGVQYGNTSNSQEWYEPDDGFTFNELVHLTLTFDGTTFKIFKNGVQTGEYIPSPTVHFDYEVLVLGRWGVYHNGYYWSGLIQSAMVYNRALTAQEIEQNYEVGTDVGLIPEDEGEDVSRSYDTHTAIYNQVTRELFTDIRVTAEVERLYTLDQTIYDATFKDSDILARLHKLFSHDNNIRAEISTDREKRFSFLVSMYGLSLISKDTKQSVFSDEVYNADLLARLTVNRQYNSALRHRMYKEGTQNAGTTAKIFKLLEQDYETSLRFYKETQEHYGFLTTLYSLNFVDKHTTQKVFDTTPKDNDILAKIYQLALHENNLTAKMYAEMEEKFDSLLNLYDLSSTFKGTKQKVFDTNFASYGFRSEIYNTSFVDYSSILRLYRQSLSPSAVRLSMYTERHLDTDTRQLLYSDTSGVVDSFIRLYADDSQAYKMLQEITDTGVSMYDLFTVIHRERAVDYVTFRSHTTPFYMKQVVYKEDTTQLYTLQRMIEEGTITSYFDLVQIIYSDSSVEYSSEHRMFLEEVSSFRSKAVIMNLLSLSHDTRTVLWKDSLDVFDTQQQLQTSIMNAYDSKQELYLYQEQDFFSSISVFDHTFADIAKLGIVIADEAMFSTQTEQSIMLEAAREVNSRQTIHHEDTQEAATEQLLFLSNEGHPSTYDLRQALYVHRQQNYTMTQFIFGGALSFAFNIILTDEGVYEVDTRQVIRRIISPPTFLQNKRWEGSQMTRKRPDMSTSITQRTFDTAQLDDMHRNMSIETLWEKSYLCPCRNRKTRSPNPACRRCNGRGIAFHPPSKIQIIIQSQEKGISNIDLGLLESGTAIGTPERNTKVAFRDRITLPQVQVSQSYIFEADPERLSNGFFMVYDVNSIEFATTLERDLVEGEDYTFDFNKNIFYPKEHLAGQVISLNISTTLRYLVADLLKEHRYTRNDRGQMEWLNQKLLLKREDLFIDSEAFDLGTEEGGAEKMVDTKRPHSPNGINGFFRGGEG